MASPVTATIDVTHWLLDLVVSAAEAGFIGGAVGEDQVAHPLYLTRPYATTPDIRGGVIVPDGIRDAATCLSALGTLRLPSGDQVRFAAPSWGIGFSIFRPYRAGEVSNHIAIGSDGLYAVQATTTTAAEKIARGGA